MYSLCRDGVRQVDLHSWELLVFGGRLPHSDENADDSDIRSDASGYELDLSPEYLLVGSFDFLYGIPQSGQAHVLKVDLQRRMVKQISLGGEGFYSLEATCITQSGKIYALPEPGRAHVLEIDPAKDIVRYIGPPLMDVDDRNMDGPPYVALIEAENGKIYAPPCGAAQAMEINPVDGSVSFIGSVLKDDPEDSDDDDFHGCQKYCCMVAAPNGKLYAPPQSARRVLEIDPNNSLAKLIGVDLGDGGECGYTSILAGTGAPSKFYCASSSSRNILHIDTYKEVTVNERVRSGEGGYCGLARASNGFLYGAPIKRKSLRENKCLEIRPESGSLHEFCVVGNNYRSIQSASDGDILIAIPETSSSSPPYNLLIFRASLTEQPLDMQSFLGQHVVAEQFSDIIIRVGGVSFPAHRLVLSRFGYFQAMFQCERFRESTQSEINLEMNVPAEAFHAILRYMYTDDASFVFSMRPAELCGLLHASSHLMLPLMDTVVQRMVDMCSTAEAAEVSEEWRDVAKLYDIPLLMRSCSELVAQRGFKRKIDG